MRCGFPGSPVVKTSTTGGAGSIPNCACWSSKKKKEYEATYKWEGTALLVRLTPWTGVEHELRVKGKEEHLKPSDGLWFPQTSTLLITSFSNHSLKVRKMAAISSWLLLGVGEPGGAKL